MLENSHGLSIFVKTLVSKVGIYFDKMMNTRHFILIAAVVSLTSCSTALFSSGFSTEVAATEGLAMLDPVSAIFYLDEKNKESFSDSLSQASEALMEQLSEAEEWHQKALEIRLDFHARIPLNEDQREEAVAFLRYAEDGPRNRIQELPIPGVLDSLIEANGERYALFLFTEGMMRDRRGYAKEVAGEIAGAVVAGVLSAVLGGGAVYAAGGAAIAATHIHAAVLDAQLNRVVFFNRDFRQDENIRPLDAEAVNRQLRRLFRPFLK